MNGQHRAMLTVVPLQVAASDVTFRMYENQFSSRL
jgi:hypothetical protein